MHEKAREAFFSWKDHQSHFIKRGVRYNPKNNVVIVRGRPEGKTLVKGWLFGRNIVTNDGDQYYAKKSCGETPATNENFLQGRHELRTGAATPAKTDTYSAVTTPVTASRQTIKATYPKTNDTGDADNTGDAVDTASYAHEWTAASFSATGIIGGCIHDNASPVAGTKLLNHYSNSTYDKTTSDTLKIFVNHTMNGV